MNRWAFAPARLVAGVLLVCALGVPATASAAAGGDANKGDVWLDTVGAPSGPGHEMDPHLPCADINLWGDKLADPNGTYTIGGWSPSGNKARAYASNWKYDGSSGGSQVIDVINVQTLIANAAANGDAPVNKQGYHFKLEFSQDPQKHKTFWVHCPAPSPSQPGTSGGGQETQTGTSGTPTGASGTPTGASGTQTGTSGTQTANGTQTGASGTQTGASGEQGGTQTAPAGQQEVLGVRFSGRSHRAHPRHRAQRRHRKHHRVQRQAVLPAFAG
jgi:hypothetical protein